VTVPAGTLSKDPIEVFYSYAHEDEELRVRLSNHLRILVRQGVISDWWDRKITAGEEFAEKIDQHLEQARVILLLISSDFMASDYCYEIEMKRALERHDTGDARVVAVLLRPVLWEESPFSRLNVLPIGARPVTSWPDVDEAFANVAAGIKAVVQELLPRASFGMAAAVPMPETDPSEVRALPKAWNVPYPRNPNFVGRDDTLRALHDAFTSGRPGSGVQVIHGPPGSGKTSVAVEYAYRYASGYRIVWWVRAEQPTNLAVDYAGLAWRVGLPERAWSSQDASVAAVRRWLGGRSDWLLVFDNATDPSLVGRFVPADAKGHVLITSRTSGWETIANPSALMGLSQEDAVDFIQKRTGQADAMAADALATDLGGMPLALEQAAAYITATDASVASYANELGRVEKQLPERRRPSADGTASEQALWRLSFGRIRDDSEPAADLLTLLAFLAPEDIPVSLLVMHGHLLPEPLASTVTVPEAVQEAGSVLRRFSLARSAGDALFVHRRAQAMVLDAMDDAGRRRWANVAVRLIDSAFPQDAEDVRSWPACSRLLSHGLVAASHAEALHVAPEVAGRLLSSIALFLNARAQFSEAKSAIDRALALDEEALGPDHPAVARDHNYRGRILRFLGDLGGARTEYERAVAIDEKAKGPDHPSVATHLVGLGRVLLESGDTLEARGIHDRALAIDEAVDPPNDADVARDLVMLGRVLHELGEVEQAMELYARAIAKDEMVYGGNHPEVATDLVDMGRALMERGDHANARIQFERALAIDEAGYGPSHPSVARGLANLGRVLEAEGDREEARSVLEQALSIDEAAFGRDHPFVARDLMYLVDLLADIGETSLARSHCERALAILEGSRGPNHPDTLKATTTLQILDASRKTPPPTPAEP
jgi:tetratricopeptide (TPR) repeat protein